MLLYFFSRKADKFSVPLQKLYATVIEDILQVRTSLRVKPL